MLRPLNNYAKKLDTCWQSAIIRQQENGKRIKSVDSRYKELLELGEPHFITGAFAVNKQFSESDKVKPWSAEKNRLQEDNEDVNIIKHRLDRFKEMSPIFSIVSAIDQLFQLFLRVDRPKQRQIVSVVLHIFLVKSYLELFFNVWIVI